MPLITHRKATKGYKGDSRKCTKSDNIIEGRLLWAQDRCPGSDTRVGCCRCMWSAFESACGLVEQCRTPVR